MLEELFAARKTALVKHRMVLFGSRARGTAKQRSDFDLANTNHRFREEALKSAKVIYEG